MTWSCLLELKPAWPPASHQAAFPQPMRIIAYHENENPQACISGIFVASFPKRNVFL